MEKVVDFILKTEINILFILIFIILIITLISWFNSACNEIDEKRKRRERMLYGHELEEAEWVRLFRSIRNDIKEKKKK